MAKNEALINVKVDTKQAEKSLKDLEKEQENYAKGVSAIETKLYKERQKLLTKQTKQEKEASAKRIKQLTATKNQLSSLANSAGNEMKKFSDSVEEGVGEVKEEVYELGDAFGMLGGSFDSAKKGVASLGQGFKALLANPVLLMITGLVAGLTALYKAFTRSEEGANKMNKIFAYLEGLLIPIIKGAEDLGGAIFDAFTNPKQALIDFSEAMQNYVIDKVNTFLDGISLLGSAIKKVFNNDWEGAMEDASAGAKKLLVELNPVYDIIDGVAEATKKATKEALSYADANAQLSASEAQLVKMQRENEVLLSKQLKDRELLMNIRDNENLSIEERIEANEELNRIESEQLERSKQEKQLALEVAVERARLHGETTENLEAIKEAQVELNNVIADSAGRENEYILNKIGLQKEQIEYQKAEIDFELEKVNITEKSEEEKLKAKTEALKKTQKLLNENSVEYKQIAKEIVLSELELEQFRIDKKKEAEDEIAENKLKAEKKTCEAQGGEWIDGEGCSFVARDTERAEANKELLIQAGLEQAQALSDALFNQANANAERQAEARKNSLDKEAKAEEARIDELRENEKISEEESARLKTELAEKTAKKQNDIDKKLFQQKKKRDIAQAIMNGALAITNILATTPKADFGVASAILIASSIASTATQVGVIGAQKFAKGGVLEGASHAQGGIPMTIDGRGGYEAEGGEAIINKASTAMFREELSIINQAGGGVKFANGGMLGESSSNGAGNISSMSSQLQELIEISKRPTRAIVSETEITESQSRISSIEERSSF